MEGEKILQNILKRESRQLQYLKNYTAPCEKILGGDVLRYIGKKPAEYEKLCKYGVFSMRLLRFCVEALSKGKKQAAIQEDCFKCAILGADILSKLVASGITLPSEISILGIIRLFYHLILNALKVNCFNNLLPITRSLVNITRSSMKASQDNITKDSAGLCNQISYHLWNAAIKLSQDMDKEQKALLALSLREYSIDLFAVANFDVSTMIERGLVAVKYFQVEMNGSSERHEGQVFLFGLLGKVVTLVGAGSLEENVTMYSRLEDLCITCCKFTVTPSHVHELLRSFNLLVRKDTRNNASSQSRLGSFQCILQILFCVFCFRLKHEKELENHQYDLDLKWSAIQKRLCSTLKALRELDQNLYTESQILLAINYLRWILGKILSPTEKISENRLKIPSDVLPTIYDLLLVCYNIQSHVIKSKMTSDDPISSCNNWEMIVQPKLAMLFLISTIVLKILNNEIAKSQNGRKIPKSCEYVSMMVEGMKMLDGVVGDVPAALEKYVRYSCHVSRIGSFMLHNCIHINEATSLARLSCEAAVKWYHAKSSDTKVITEVALCRKYELLSDCLAKQGHWLESLRAMSLCCHYHILSSDDCATKSDVKPSEYVIKWSNRKDDAIKHQTTKKDVYKVQKCNLDDECKDPQGPNLNEEQICTLLKMELESYRETGFCTPSNQLCVVEKLFKIYTSRQDETNATLMKLEKVKAMYYMTAQTGDVISTASDGLGICEDLMRDVNEMLHEQPDSILLKDLLASAYFWRFILQYLQAVEQMKDEMKDEMKESSREKDKIAQEISTQIASVNSLNNLWLDFLPSLHLAVNIWTDLVNEVIQSDEKQLDVYSQSETLWMLQIASCVYGFLNMPLIRVHTLLVLATFASHCGGKQNFQTVIIANSLAIQTLCDEGNLSPAELLQNECEEIISCLGEQCETISNFVFSIAKSQLFLCKGLFHEGWQLVKTVLDEAKQQAGITTQFLLVKTKFLCMRYLSLSTSVCKVLQSLEGSDCSNYFDYLADSAKTAICLVEYFLENGAGIEFAGLNHHKKERAVFLSHWSLLTELSCCFVELGKVYLLQGAVREAKNFLKDGREITKRFLSANRFSKFSLHLAELNVVLENVEQCKTYLEDVMSVLNPDLPLSDIIEKPKLMTFEQSRENCPFSDYEHISSAQLHISLVNCYCQYLKLSGTIFDVRKLISLSHDLRKCSITQYQQTLDSLERLLAVKFKSKDGVKNDEATRPTTGKGKVKAKSKRGKTTTKRNEKDAQLIPDKADVASLVFLESCLKTHSLDGDDALNESDYPRLLTNVRTGLDMVEWAQNIVKDPLLLDLMSSSLLHYLQGVAHVLASNDGFDSWRVARGHPASHEQEVDADDMSEIMSKLSVSLLAEKPTVRKSKRGANDGERELGNDYFHEDFLGAEPTPAQTKTSKRGRPAQKVTVEPATRSKRKPTSRKNVSNLPQTPLASQTQDDYEDIQSQGELPCTRKGSRSCRKKTKDSKTLSKPRKNAKINILCDEEDCQTDQRKEKGNEEIHRGKTSQKMSRDLVEQCIQIEENFDGRNGMKDAHNEDKDMKNALDSFNSSLACLHPCYNPVLLTRICHAFVLCYGMNNPEKAAVYQNLAMATTLRHQCLNRSSNKIRKEKGKQGKEGKEDELLKPRDSEMIHKGNSVNQVLQLQTIKNAVGFQKSAGNILESFRSTMELLPEDLTVCTLSIVQAPDRENVKHLVVTRLRRNNQSLVLKLNFPNEEDEGNCMEKEFQTNDCVVRNLSSIFRRSILSDFASIMRDFKECNKIKSEREWWSRRSKIDNQLERFVGRMEETWFEGWRGILNGRRMDEVDRTRLHSYVQKIQEMAVEILGRRIQNEQLLEVFVDSFCRLLPNDIMKSLAKLTGVPTNCKQLFKFSKMLSNFLDGNESVDNAFGIRRGPVVLILDKVGPAGNQFVYFEKIRKGERVVKAIQHLPFEAMPILRNQEVSRMPSLHFINAHLNLQKIKMSTVDTRQTFYVLNPQDNLPNTEERFSDWFSSEKGWKGIIGRAPSAEEFKEALANHQLFIYVGHGNGREFLKGDEITRLYCQAVAVIMGCSSGKLIVEGQCDARGMALNYLLSGSPTVVGNLWDVTDVDIDKFTTNVLRLWFKETLSLMQCVVKSRQACNMKYANGAAPIVYGMPVYTRTVKEIVKE